MPYNYSLKEYDEEHMAKAVGRALPISTKHSIEICNFIRNKELAKAKGMLKKVIEKNMAVPFKRFNGGVGHKVGIGPGRFPVKASREILSLLESIEANAQFKGLDTSSLFINHICANYDSKSWHHGRQRRRKMKRTNIQVVVREKPKNLSEGNPKESKEQDKK